MDKKTLAIAGGVVIVLVLIAGISRKGKKAESGKTAKVQQGASLTADQLYARATKLRDDRKIEEARDAYQSILSEYPDYQSIATVQKELEDVNMQIIFSNIPTASSVIHDVQAGDTLGKLAKKYGTTVDLIKINNNLRNNVIRVGQKLRIWDKPFNLFVDKSQNILMLREGNQVLKVYSVSTGENNSTPVGTFRIETKLVDPVWFNRGVVVPPESPENVLGTRWLGFDIPGYGIHGTTEPETIGQQVTAGCVRMRNEEVEEIYSIIPLGTEVVVVD